MTFRTACYISLSNTSTMTGVEKKNKLQKHILFVITFNSLKTS